MAKYHSEPIHQRDVPQYAYALAILSGGGGYVASQLVQPLTALLSYALLAALFASIWSYKALQWGVWLCLPIGLLIFFDVVATGNLVGVLLANGMMFVKTLFAACLGAYVGSKLSIHHFANRSAHRKRLKSRRNGAPSGPDLKKLPASDLSVTTIPASQSANDALPSLQPLVHLNNINAALMSAAREGDPDKVRLLVADGAEVNAQSNHQWSPLMITARDSDAGVVSTIFGKGVSMGASDGKGWTPLMTATIAGHAEVVRALLEHGAEVNAENYEGWTALRFAVSMDETEILRLLLEAGADANRADHEGQTALMQAARESCRESLKTLLEMGADPSIKDHNQQTALEIAQKYGHTEITSLLEEADAEALARVEAPVRKAWLSPMRLLTLAAIFHLTLTLTIFLFGRYASLPNTFDRDGIGISFAADGIQYCADAALLSEILKRGEILNWRISNYPFHVKLYSICFLLFGSLFGSNIISAEPLNALYYLAILILVFHIGREVFNKRTGLLAAAVAALWPSFLLHTTQLLRDPLFVAGMLALVLILLRLSSARTSSWPGALLTGGVGGLASVVLWIARDNLGEIVVATVFMGALMLIARQFQRAHIQIANLFGMALLIAMTISAQQFLPKYVSPSALPPVRAEAQQGTLPASNAVEIRRTATAAPAQSFWSRMVAKVGRARRRFIVLYPDAGSNVDSNVQLTNTTDLIRYFPRAAIIGFFAPFPEMWLTMGKEVGLAGRLLAGAETFLIYVVEAFALYGLWHRRRQLSAWFLFSVAATGMIALGFVVVNIGALFRLRYLFLMLIIILGAEGMTNALGRFSKKQAEATEPCASA
jgi:ankyrin repeat protein